MIQNRKIQLGILLILGFLLCFRTGHADFLQPRVKFFTLKETVQRLLPGAPVLTRREIHLTDKQLRKLERFDNWDSRTTDFTFYHAKNREKKITRTLILFPENTRRGMMLVGVALSNKGEIVDAVLMEAQNQIVQWLLPLQRADYMKTFIGKDYRFKIRLEPRFRKPPFTPLTQDYAHKLANAVKKSAQLFRVLFRGN